MMSPFFEMVFQLPDEFIIQQFEKGIRFFTVNILSG
jgi:hypothetical protein